MQNYYDISVIFLILCLSCNVVAKEKDCECDVLQIYNTAIFGFNKTYTKQSIDIKGKNQTFYISKENTIWWNQKTKHWDFYEFDKNSEGIYIYYLSKCCNKTETTFSPIGAMNDNMTS